MKPANPEWKLPETWPIWIAGDWRKKEGNGPSLYDATNGLQPVAILGGNGLYWYGRCEWWDAIDAWNLDLEVVRAIQETEGERQHKGWFYFMIADAYRMLGDKKRFAQYREWAKEEDVLSYGEGASTFPAATSEIQPEVTEDG